MAPSQTAAASPQPHASPDQLQTGFDNSIWYLLSLWSPLHIAVQNSWGGPSSSDKRDWFAGAISDLFNTRPDTDAEDLECFLLQIMQDEFDCNVEDESEVQLAREILSLRGHMMETRTTGPADEVKLRWDNRGSMKGDLGRKITVQEVNQDADDDDDNDGDEGADDDDDQDEDMEDVPQLVPGQPSRQRPVPEVDEDGFTKVAGKKQR